LGQGHGHKQLVCQVSINSRPIVQESEQLGNSRTGHFVGRQTLSAKAAKSCLWSPENNTCTWSFTSLAKRPDVCLKAAPGQ
jgi:hypothetical protein